MDIKLSYILTTYNKAAYLKVTLPHLIAARRADEEIVIVDGGSTDGAKEYLEELYREKKIQQFISEKDCGEAHGTNKAILLARGTLLKIITDDDLFDFDVINACKEHLLKHEAIDICGTDGLGISTIHKNKDLLTTNYTEGFLEWKKTGAPFLFCGLSYMIRRSSVSKLGLLATQFKMIDLEYSVRVSAMKANIAFCNAYSFVNIVGADSNSNKFYSNIKAEKNKLSDLYPGISNLNNTNNLYIGLKEKIKRIVNTKQPAGPALTDAHEAYIKAVAQSLDALKNKNKKIEIIFL